MNAILLTMLASLGPFALLLLMGVAFAETGFLAGFLLPADTVLLSAGMLVAAGSLRLPVWLSLLSLTLAAAGGGQLAYFVGGRLARGSRNGPGSKRITAERVARAQSLFERHGAKAVLLSRFVPVARTLTPVLAGVVGMDRRRFLVHNLTGAAVWAAVTFGGGYWLGAISGVSSHLALVMLGTAALAALPTLVSPVRRRMRHARTSEAPHSNELPARPAAHAC